MTALSPLTLDHMIVQGEGQVSTVVDGKAVLMHVENGKYFNMDNIGTRIWVLIATPKCVGAVCEQLVQEYEVERATCDAGVLLLLESLLKNDLISVAPPAQADQ